MKRPFQGSSAVATATLASAMTMLGASAAAASESAMAGGADCNAAAKAEMSSQTRSVQSTTKTTTGDGKSETRIEQSRTTLEDGELVTRRTVRTIIDGEETVEEEVTRRPADAEVPAEQPSPVEDGGDIDEQIEALHQDIEARIAAIRAKAWGEAGKP